MHDLVYELKQLGWHNRDGSYGTQAERRATLRLCGEQLVAMGWKQLHATELKQRHIWALVRRWQEETLSAGTLANRMATLRWWTHKIGKPYLMAATNAAYGIVARERVPRVSRAQALPEEVLARVTDPYIWHSLNLQRTWGLRKAECLLVRPHRADGGDRLLLQGSWCKNGRYREVALRSPRQRDALDLAKAFVMSPDASLIPVTKSFIQQRRVYEYWVRKLGLSALHGVRHWFAQDTYRELAGMEPPITGGPMRKDMTTAQVLADEAARSWISEMLGHSRLAITSVYLGQNT